MHWRIAVLCVLCGVVLSSDSPHTLQPELPKSSCVSDRSLNPASLPEGPLIIAYANWGQCDERIDLAVERGVNVVMWFAINLEKDTNTNQPKITSGPDFECVARTVARLNQKGLHASHLISIGGWDAPHPDTSFTGAEWFEAWHTWNCEVVARSDLGFLGFDGFDWDIEGNDTPTSEYNQFTIATLDLMGEMSVHAKAAGYLVTMAPAESYMDQSTSLFDLSLTHPYPEWKPEFLYHGHNTYAYLLAKYATAFDLVSIQLYESWSHANFNITQGKNSASEYLQSWMASLVDGWFVDFASVPEANLPSQFIRIEPSKLVVGVANGWAGDERVILLWPEDLAQAYHSMQLRGQEPRGFMFWNIADEGREIQNRTLVMSEALNAFLHVRS